MITYSGPNDDPHEVIRFLRREIGNLRALRKVRISPEGTIVFDVNKDGLEFPGLTYGSPVLERLLQELGVVFRAETLHERPASPRGRTEFDLSARYSWGQDRVM